MASLLDEPLVKSNVREFTGEYNSPPHVANNSLLGCLHCDGFTFLINTDGDVICHSCGSAMRSIGVVTSGVE